MPTKVKFKKDDVVSVVEDHLAIIFEKRGLVEIIGGFVYEDRKKTDAKKLTAKKPKLGASKAVRKSSVEK